MILKSLILIFVFLPLVAAQSPEKDPTKRRQKILERFDTDGDGVLSEDEKQALSAALKNRQGKRNKAGKKRNSTKEGGEGCSGGKCENKNSKSVSTKTPQERKSAMRKRFDKNGDGVLSQEERQKAIAFLKQKRSKNKNSKASNDSRKKGPFARGGDKNKEGRKAKALKRFDKDGDGQLSAEEKQELRRFLRKRHKRNKKGQTRQKRERKEEQGEIA